MEGGGSGIWRDEGVRERYYMRYYMTYYMTYYITASMKQ